MPRWCLCWLAHPDSSPPASAAQHPNPAALPSIPASCPAQLSCIPDALPGSALPGHCRFLFSGLRFLFPDIRILAAKPGNNGVLGGIAAFCSQETILRKKLQSGNNSPAQIAARKQNSHVKQTAAGAHVRRGRRRQRRGSTGSCRQTQAGAGDAGREWRGGCGMASARLKAWMQRCSLRFCSWACSVP